MGSNRGPLACEAIAKLTTQWHSAIAENAILRIFGNCRMKRSPKKHLRKMFFKVNFSKKKELKILNTTSERRTSLRRCVYLSTTYSRRGWFIAIGYQIPFEDGLSLFTQC